MSAYLVTGLVTDRWPWIGDDPTVNEMFKQQFKIVGQPTITLK